MQVPEVMQSAAYGASIKRPGYSWIDHEDIDNIDKTIYRIDEMVSQKEKEQSLTDIAELRFLVQDLADKEVLSLANIF